MDNYQQVQAKRMDELRDFHESLLSHEFEFEDQSALLAKLADFERKFRRFFLDEKELAREQDKFLRDYYMRNPQIFFPSSQKFLEYIWQRPSDVYVVELSKSEQRTDRIDAVSFYPIHNTAGILRVASGYSGMPEFTRHGKGEMAHSFWSTHSFGEKTRIKVRSRIHQKGSSVENPEVLPPHLREAFDR